MHHVRQFHLIGYYSSISLHDPRNISLPSLRGRPSDLQHRRIKTLRNFMSNIRQPIYRSHTPKQTLTKPFKNRFTFLNLTSARGGDTHPFLADWTVWRICVEQRRWCQGMRSCQRSNS
jgi:hypothetical protein